MSRQKQPKKVGEVENPKGGESIPLMLNQITLEFEAKVGNIPLTASSADSLRMLVLKALQERQVEEWKWFIEVQFSREVSFSLSKIALGIAPDGTVLQSKESHHSFDGDNTPDGLFKRSFKSHAWDALPEFPAKGFKRSSYQNQEIWMPFDQQLWDRLTSLNETLLKINPIVLQLLEMDDLSSINANLINLLNHLWEYTAHFEESNNEES